MLQVSTPLGCPGIRASLYASPRLPPAAAARATGLRPADLPPLLRPPQAVPTREDFDSEIYRDQLGEIERDAARGRHRPVPDRAHRFVLCHQAPGLGRSTLTAS